METPTESANRLELPMAGFRVARDQDRSGEHHSLGIGLLSIKVSTEDSRGVLLVAELVHYARGGPPRHRHHSQDEWFYVAEGEYLLEVGAERFHLRPGDLVFGPRVMPHLWAHVDDGRARGRCS